MGPPPRQDLGYLLTVYVYGGAYPSELTRQFFRALLF